MPRILLVLALVTVTPRAQCIWGPTSAAMQGWGFWDVCSGDLGNGVRIYGGGTFSVIGGTVANNIAEWDGTQWSPLGVGIHQAIVRRLLIFDDGTGKQLYAGGTFPTSVGNIAAGLIRWDGSQWTDVGGFDGTVYDMEIWDDGSGPALFVGGRNQTVNGSPLGNVAKWDGQNWTTVGGSLTHSNPVSEWVSSIEILPTPSGGELWVTGSFEFVNGQPTDRITRLVAGSWQPMTMGLAPSVPWDLKAFVGHNGPRIYLTAKLNGTPGGDVVLECDGSTLQVSAALPYSTFMAVHDDGTGAALYVTRATTETHRLDPHTGVWSQVPGTPVYGNRSGLASVTDGQTTALLSLGIPQYNGTVQGANPVVCSGGPGVTLRQEAPGAPVSLTSANLINGEEYHNFVSVDPCTAIGTGPYGGLCATTGLAFLQQQLAMPIGTHPFHFVAVDNSQRFDPVLLPPGLTIDVICVRFIPGGAQISPVERITVQ